MSSSSKKKNKKGTNWTSILFFILLVIGPNIASPLSRILFHVSGGNLLVSSNVLLVGMFGLLIVLTVVMRVVNFFQQTGETTLSTGSFSSGSSQPWQSQSTSPSAPWAKSATTQLPYTDASSSLEALMQGNPLPSSSPRSTSTARSTDHDSPDWEDDDSSFDNELFAAPKAKAMMDWANRPAQLPNPPTFEPVVSGKVVGLGILGALLLGGGFVLLGFLNGMFP